MQTSFKVIVEAEKGREIHPADNLSEAIEIYRRLIDQYPEDQIHLVRDMPMQNTSSAAQ